jgi:hypothetical protein
MLNLAATCKTLRDVYRGDKIAGNLVPEILKLRRRIEGSYYAFWESTGCQSNSLRQLKTIKNRILSKRLKHFMLDSK